jgi:hypothetical protein
MPQFYRDIHELYDDGKHIIIKHVFVPFVYRVAMEELKKACARV